VESWRTRRNRAIAALAAIGCATVFGVSLPLPAAAHQCQFSARRLADAQRLTEESILLEQQTNFLRQAALKIYLADTVTETNQAEHPASNPRERYLELLTEYQQALAAYTQHRKDVQAHANQFHQQAQDQKILDAPIEVTMPKVLKLRAQDACYQLQVQERMLAQSEFQLRNMVNALASARGQMAPDDYMRQLGIGQNNAVSLLQAARSFEDGVMTKQTVGSQSLNSQVHLAFDTGDFVGSQKVYDEVERRHALIQQEVERAGAHMSLARTFMLKLSLLNANASGSSSASAETGSGDGDSFADADAQLDKEFQHVQELYSELQSARPTR